MTRLSSTLSRIAVAAAIAAGCASASALPAFTFDPTAVGLAGPAFSADNILISNYAATTYSAPGAFTQTGYLSVGAFQDSGGFKIPTGLNSTWGLYIAYTGTGTTNVGDPTTTDISGSFDTLSFTLYGYNGGATFSVAGGTPTETASGEIALATGSLIAGTVKSSPSNGSFAPSAEVTLSLTPDATNSAFFQSPTPFYTTALAAFINTSSQVTATATGFTISQGGGALNFATPVPEPGVQMLLLSGLAAVGFIARRRRS
jgi:hypothetical protein